jgi:carboxyl-terminal processing protease
MKKDIKALIARDIYSRNDFYKIIMEDDEVIKKALEVIDNQKEYNNLLVSTD